MEKYRKSVITILIIIGVICLAAGCFYMVRSFIQNRDNHQTLETLRPSVRTPEDIGRDIPASPSVTGDDADTDIPSDNGNTDTSASHDYSDSDAEEKISEPVENPYRDSFLANKDMAAWLLVPDTGIDYPVMWTPRDENYYLKRGFDGRDNQNGCLILDTDSSLEPLTTNLIIHGHNMRSGAMFGNLTKYEEEAYCQEHSQMYLYTPECQRCYEVIAVFRSQVFKKNDDVFKFYQFFQADTQEEFDDFYQNIKEMSIYDTGVTAEFGDCFLTLSTCAYHVEQGRFVVVAKEVATGDTYLPLTTESNTPRQAEGE